MKIIVVGATGTIGSAVADALAARHEVVRVSRRGPVQADLEDAASLDRLFDQVRGVDAVVSCAGNTARRRPLAELSDEDFAESIRGKLMGQVNLARIAMHRLRDGGSITLTGGVLSREPLAGASHISMVNAALEGFVLGAALEMPRGIRINLVSPPWISETLAALDMRGPRGIPAVACARAYVSAVEGTQKGETLDGRRF